MRLPPPCGREPNGESARLGRVKDCQTKGYSTDAGLCMARRCLYSGRDRRWLGMEACMTQPHPSSRDRISPRTRRRLTDAISTMILVDRMSELDHSGNPLYMPGAFRCVASHAQRVPDTVTENPTNDLNLIASCNSSASGPRPRPGYRGAAAAGSRTTRGHEVWEGCRDERSTSHISRWTVYRAHSHRRHGQIEVRATIAAPRKHRGSTAAACS